MSHIIKFIPLKSIIQWVLVYPYTRCATITTITNFRMFSLQQKEIPHSFAVILHSPSSQPVATSNLISISMALPILDI